MKDVIVFMENVTKEEISELENLERIVLLYDLMMKRMIEEKGQWSSNGRPKSAADNLKILVDRISGSFEAEPDMLLATLDLAFRQGNLEYTNSSGKIQWQWVNFLN